MSGEKPTPKEYLVGVRDANGNINKKEALTMFVDVDSGVAAKNEQTRNANTVRNLSEVFDTVAGSQHMSLMFQEQSPLITEYLKDTTKSGEGGEVYNQMAPGIAMLGFEMARSGFGRSEISSGDEKIDKEGEDVAKKRYKAAEEVFNQLMNKMYPTGTSIGLVEQLKAPLGMANETIFAEIGSGLEELYKKGLPDDDKGILKYQSQIDSLIQTVGDTLGKSAETNAKLGVEGTITVEEQKRYQNDMLTMAMVLRDLQKLRRESVRHEHHQSTSYDNFSPVDLKRIENLKRGIKGYTP